MAVKFTPGPWEVRDETTIYGRGMAKFTIIRVATAHRDHSSLTAEANARLIASAPELLEALQGVLWMAEEWFKHGGDETTFSDDYKESLDEARAVILKATGEA
jgi:hypothetical protein